MNKKRKLLDGSLVDFLDNPVQLVIHTRVPQKWKIIDMETGEEYLGTKTPHPIFSEVLKEKVALGNVGSWKKIKFKKTNDKKIQTVNSINKEICFFCQKEGKYFDFINGDLKSVCQKHLSMEASS